MIHESSKLWSALLRKSGMKLSLSLKEDLPHIRGDYLSLLQLINNLSLNAIEAMDREGILEITTCKGKSYFNTNRDMVIIKVKDTGCGISSQNEKKIFNPFFTTKASGTGLGLAIAHQVVERHGGVVLLESHPGEGTIFTIEIPCLSKKQKGDEWKSS